MMTVLITGCSMHNYDLIVEMRKNYDNEEIRIVGINCSDIALLRNGVDAGYIVPRITDETYIPTLLSICKAEKVDVIMPFITAELPLLAEKKEFFEEHGIKVAVSSKESLDAVNDKIALSKKFGDLMPRQKTVETVKDIFDFAQEIGYPNKQMCCKLPNKCGGIGFCIVDEVKGRDLTLVNKFGMNHHITFEMLLTYFRSLKETMILQEYEEGTDYSMCILADNGRIVHAMGFEASQMSFGSAMNASISFNQQAYEVAKQVVEDTGFDGNACFDFILKPNGSVKLLEVNPRISATLAFIARAGLDLAYMRCKQLLGQDIENVELDVNENLCMMKTYASTYFEKER